MKFCQYPQEAFRQLFLTIPVKSALLTSGTDGYIINANNNNIEKEALSWQNL